MDTTHALDDAMRALLHAKTWEGVRQVMDRYPILTSPDAIKELVDEANASGERHQHDRRVWLMVHAYLLDKCQELGVAKGFADWKQALTDQIRVATEWTQHYLSGNASDLNEAIDQNMWALMGTRFGEPLAKFWDPLIDQLRFLLQESIDKHDGGLVARSTLLRLLQQNADHVSKDDLSWPKRTMLYAGACAQWFQFNGDGDALDRAIDLMEQAVAASPDPEWISGAGRLRLFRFESKSSAPDLQAAIAAQRRALQLMPASNPAMRAMALDRLGISLRTSFEHSGVIDELDEAIITHEEAVRISPEDSPDHPARLGNMASALLVRYSLAGDDKDHRRAGELLRKEVELCGKGHPLRADALGNLGSWLVLEKGGTLPPENPSEAIDVLREAIQLAGHRHVGLLWELSLAKALIAASPSPHDENRLEAQQRLEAVLNGTPGGPNRALALALLGKLHADAGLDDAGDMLAEAVDIGLATRPDAALSAAASWRSWAASGNFIDHLKNASSRSLDVLDSLGLRQDRVQDQLLWRQRARAAVEDAAFDLAVAGEPDLAVAHLERGRATVLRQLNLTPTAQAAADSLASVLPEMLIAYLVAGRRGGVVLIPGQQGVTAHPLHDFTTDRVHDAVVKLITAQAKRTQPGGLQVWRDHLDGVTRWMYAAVIETLQDAMGEIGPRLALLTDGLIGMLPWAAAWKPQAAGPAGRMYFIDRPVDLTIAPTAQMLAGALYRARGVEANRTLIVAPRQSARNALKHIDAEVAAVAAAHAGAAQLRSSVTPGAVLKAAREADIIHFACHGGVDLLDPLKSYLALTDNERLNVADLIADEPRPRRLAVLSACETGAAGLVAPTEVVGFPAAFLRSGFAGVVGSLWPVRDDGTALLMGKFHELLATQSPATALASAQRWLRNLSPEEANNRLGRPVDGEFSRIETWGAFTYSGA